MHSLKAALNVDVPAQFIQVEKSELDAWFAAHLMHAGINSPALVGFRL